MQLVGLCSGCFLVSGWVWEALFAGCELSGLRMVFDEVEVFSWWVGLI